MEELRFPVINKNLPDGKKLSMDEYVKFVFLHLKYTLNKKRYRESKKSIAVNKSFSLLR